MRALVGLALLAVALPAFAQGGWPPPAGTASRDGWPATYPPLSPDGWPENAAPAGNGMLTSCDYVNGLCRIDIRHPLARRIPGAEVQRIGPTSGLVTPQAYASAQAGRPVQIVKISVVPVGQRLQAIIEWR